VNQKLWMEGSLMKNLRYSFLYEKYES